MEHEGGCHCGAVRYRVSGVPEHVSVCHCSDCRKSAGAPFVSWADFKVADFKVEGKVSSYNSSANAYRHFCAKCGTGLYYVNEQVLPGLVDIQTATLDDPEVLTPQLHVQAAEQLKWTRGLESLPKFERYPS
jgi:hypothetical protein